MPEPSPDWTLFRDSVLNLVPDLSEGAWAYLCSGLREQRLSARENFVTLGEVQESIGFVAKGLLRGYYINEKGDEVTVRFAAEGDFATHYSAFIARLPSRYQFQGLEDSRLWLLSYGHIQEGYRRFHELERYGRKIAEQVLSLQQHRIEQFQFEKAEQRYLRFLKDHPHLFQRISLTHLASYLGIERPSLSRIRKKLSDKPL